MDVFLETGRMVLRRFTADDVELLVELDSDPEVMRWLSGGAPTPREMIERETLPAFMGWYEWPGEFGYWAAVDRRSGAFVGWFALHPVQERPAEEAEVGYRLRRAFWGHGLATEGVRALLAKAFGEPGVRRVYGTTYEENVGSRRVMEKAGMRLARRFRWDPSEPGPAATFVSTGEVWAGEDVEYAVTRGEWLAANAGSE